jgi:hypothetical protein
MNDEEKVSIVLDCGFLCSNVSEYNVMYNLIKVCKKINESLHTTVSLSFQEHHLKISFVGMIPAMAMVCIVKHFFKQQ